MHIRALGEKILLVNLFLVVRLLLVGACPDLMESRRELIGKKEKALNQRKVLSAEASFAAPKHSYAHTAVCTK